MKRHTGYGWLELIEGILLIILGALSITSPGGILRWITIFYGVMAVVTGITDIRRNVTLGLHHAWLWLPG